MTSTKLGARRWGKSMAVLCGGALFATGPVIAGSPKALYCDYNNNFNTGGSACLFPFVVESDWDKIASTIADVQGAFSTLKRRLHGDRNCDQRRHQRTRVLWHLPRRSQPRQQS